MAVKHNFVSAKAATADPDDIDAAKWNEPHIIEEGTITLAMLQDIATASILGRSTAGAGDPEVLTAAQARAIILPDGDKGDITVGTGGTSFTVDTNAITYAKMQDVSATQRVIGRNTAGAGDPQEVTATQLFDWVSTTNGALLTRMAGAWAPAANVAIDGDGDLLLSEETAPTTPAAAKVKLYAAKMAGRHMPAFMNSSGIVSPVQPLFGSKSVALWTAIAGGAVMQTQGINATVLGTGTLRNPSTTNLFASSRRIGYVSAATAGERCGLRYVVPYMWRGNAAGLGGFHAVFRWGWADASLVATGRGFVGLWSGTASPASDVDPDTLTNIVAVGNNNGDTNLQLYAAGGVAQPRLDLGANFPAQTVSTDWYELHLFSAPNGLSIDYKLLRLNTGHSAEGSITVSANLPSATTFIGPIVQRSNGGTAAAVAVDIGGFYSETDN